MGTGDDVVDAAAAPVRVELYGQAGDDRLTGGASADFLYGGPGADSLDAGAGDDTLDAADGAADLALTCGDGADRLDDDLADPVSDCEVVAPEWDVLPALSPGPLRGRARAVGRRLRRDRRGADLRLDPVAELYRGRELLRHRLRRGRLRHRGRGRGQEDLRVRATNAAGSVQAETAMTSVIPAITAPSPPARPRRPRPCRSRAPCDRRARRRPGRRRRRLGRRARSAWPGSGRRWRAPSLPWSPTSLAATRAGSARACASG
jgi:hypothetical protein